MAKKATIRDVEKLLTKFARDHRKEQEEKLFRYEGLLERTRAGKLLLKGKHFVVVAMDEEYYAQVYRTIRLHEKQRGRWTGEDELAFHNAMQMWVDFNNGQ